MQLGMSMNRIERLKWSSFFTSPSSSWAELLLGQKNLARPELSAQAFSSRAGQAIFFLSLLATLKRQNLLSCKAANLPFTPLFYFFFKLKACGLVRAPPMSPKWGSARASVRLLWATSRAVGRLSHRAFLTPLDATKLPLLKL